MKLRIRGNSLRLRLTQGEVARLASAGVCRETMTLAAGQLNYEVRVSDAIDRAEAIFEATDIVVTLPAPAVKAWAESDDVSIAAEHGPLSILVEKDFSCLKPRDGDDDADTFPHPQAT